MNQIDRLYRIHDILRNARRPVPMTRFMEELEASRNTITRDFQFLRDSLGAPLIYDQEHKGHHYDPDQPVFELPGFWLNASELYALLASEQLLEAVQPGLMQPHLAPLRDRIHELLGQSGHDARKVSERIKVQPILARAAPAQIFDRVAEATLANRQLRITYASRSQEETTDRLTDPQRLLHYRSNWYLLAWCRDARDLRLFSLDRIRQAQVLNAEAESRPAQELDNTVSDSFGIFTGQASATAHLRFSEQAARWVAEETWHPEQHGEWQADGYHLHIPYANPTELIMDILRHGPDVEVLGPQSLREQVREKVRAMSVMY